MFWARHRRLFLFLVYVLFFLHTALWHYWGLQGIGHLGFGEFFATMRSGVITAGTVFSILVFVHALFFGGLFCGWFCHWGITQDLAAWIMNKAGIKPQMRHLDSRLIPWIWFGIIIAQVVIFWVYNGLPQSFSFNASATPVWSGVPRSILLICLTTMISGFILIFLFGERAFCRSICTFRLWFSWFERFAPHKVRQMKECTSCSQECTSSCPMGLDVAVEIRDMGQVRNTECIKCHICIGACPNQALATSMRQNSFCRQGQPAPAKPALSPSISLLQAAMAIIIVVTFGFDVGGNMSLSLGFLSGFMLIHIWHTRSISPFEAVVSILVVVGLYFKDDLNDPISLAKGLTVIAAFLLTARFAGFSRGFDFLDRAAPELKVAKGLTAVVLIFALILGAREAQTSILIHKANAARKGNDTATYATIMESCAGSHSDPTGAYFDLGKAQLKINLPDKASASFKKSLELLFSASVAIDMYELLRSFATREVADEFATWLTGRYPDTDEFIFLKGELLIEKNDYNSAEALYQGFIARRPAHHDGYIALGTLRLQQSKLDEAEELFNRAYALAPASSAYFVAAVNHLRGRPEQAEKFYAEAVSSNPPNVIFLMDQAGNYAAQQKLDAAIAAWQKVLEIAPQETAARENIEQARAAQAAGTPLIAEERPTAPGY